MTPEARFCANCGQPVGGGPAAGAASIKGNWRRDGIIVLVLAVGVIVGYLVLRDAPQQPQQARPSNVTTPPGHEDMGAALADMPTDYAGLVAAGNENMDDGNFPVAAEMYRRALEIDGSSADVRTDFGACLHAMGLPGRALEEFRKVTTEHPEHTISQFNLGIVHYGMNNLDSARYYWQRYLELEPNGSAAETARGYLDQLDK